MSTIRVQRRVHDAGVCCRRCVKILVLWTRLNLERQFLGLQNRCIMSIWFRQIMDQPCQIISMERERELNCWNYLLGLTLGWSPSLPPAKWICQRKSKTGDNNTCSLNLSERLRLASIKPDGESESDSRRCGTFARLFLRATRASTDLTNEHSYTFLTQFLEGLL